MRRSLLLCGACLAFSAACWGADFPRAQFSGSGGWIYFWDNNGAPVTGHTVGGSAGVRLLPQFAAEFEAVGLFGSRGGSGLVDYHARGAQFTANGLLYLGHRPRAAVFLLLGAGGAYSSSETNFGDYHNTTSHAGFLANGGIGLEIGLTRHLALRPEIRASAGRSGASTVDPFTGQVRIALGIVYR